MIPQGVIIFDTLSEKITYANKELSNILENHLLTESNDYISIKKTLE